MASYIEINNLGSFANIEALWAAHPEGGQEGDYCTIDGVKYRWDKYDRMWVADPNFGPTPARSVTTFDGDVNIQNNLTVAGTLRAKRIKQPCVGLYASLEALEAKWPKPEVGMWAAVGDSFPANVYRCDTEGEWGATGGTASIDGIEFNIANGIAGWEPISSTSQLPTDPTEEQQSRAYLLGTTLYVYVGAGGDTASGKYQSAQLKGTTGKSAYQSYVDTTSDDPPLSEEAWVASLKEISDYTSEGVDERPLDPQTKVIYMIPDSGGESWTEEIWDGSNWIVLASHEGSYVETDTSLTEEGAAADSKTVGDKIGYTQSSFTWVANSMIKADGTVVTDNTSKRTNPFTVKAGSKIHATGAGENFGVISRYNEGASNMNAYTPLAVMNSDTSHEYVVKVEEDMKVSISGLKSGDNEVTAYVEHVGIIHEEVYGSYNAKLYTREDLPASMSGQPIKMNVGDILCVVCPLINNNVVQHVDSEGTAIKTLWRPTSSHGYDMFKYEKTAEDGVDYVSVIIGSSSAFGYAYMLRRKPATNVLSDDAFYAEYVTFDDAGCDITSVGYCIAKDGSVVSESTARHRVFTFENKGYKSVYAKSVSAGYNHYRIAFYSGEPSTSTFMPIYSKHSWEHESAYDSGPYEYTAIVPDGAKYIKICMRASASSNDLRLYKNVVIPQVNDIRDTFERCYSEHLLPMVYQHNTPEYLENGHFTDYKKVDLKLLFYTDLHSYHENLNRVMMLGDYLYDKGMLDCIIAGGDNCQTGAESYDWFNHTLSQSKADNLVAVGNHDASTYWNATKQSAYTNNIAPVLSRVDDIVSPSDSASAYRMYYYKDYNNVRVIVLYTPPTNDANFADDNQLPWLESVLTDARTNNKHVLIVNHHYYNTAYKWSYASLTEFWESKPNTFLTPYGKVGSSGDTNFIFPTEFLLAVKAFEDAGGKFICWLTGHGHFDNFFDVEDHETYGYQPMFNSASCAHKHSANEFVKKKGEKSQDLFNYITVDTNKTTINILRIGCNIDVFGRSRKVLTYNYGAHCIMANY